MGLLALRGSSVQRLVLGGLEDKRCSGKVKGVMGELSFRFVGSPVVFLVRDFRSFNLEILRGDN